MNGVHRVKKKNCFEMIESQTTKRVHLKLARTVRSDTMDHRL